MFVKVGPSLCRNILEMPTIPALRGSAMAPTTSIRTTIPGDLSSRSTWESIRYTIGRRITGWNRGSVSAWRSLGAAGRHLIRRVGTAHRIVGTTPLHAFSAEVFGGLL